MEYQQRGEPADKPRTALYGLAAVAILYLAREVLVPVALAILLTFVVSPLVGWIERRVRSRALAVLLATLLVVGVLGGGVIFAVQQFAGITEDLPEYRDTILRKVRAVQAGPGQFIERLRSFGADMAKPETPPEASPGPPEPPSATPVADPPPAPVPDTIPEEGPPGWSIVEPLIEPLAFAAIVIVLLILMLMARENIRDRIIRLAGLNQIGFTTQTLEEAGARVSRYLRAQLLINTTFAAAVAIGLLIIGLPNAALCGVIAGVLRFIPILGPWLGAAIPSALALAVFDGWSHVIIVASLFAALEIFSGVVLEPWLYGSSTGLSSLGVIFALIFWTWVWGAIGLVLAMPMTVCIVVFTRHVPHLSALSILLGNEPALPGSMRYYQRLLVGDEDEAAAIIGAAPADAEPDAVMDEIVMPGLSAARTDHRRGLITMREAVRIARTAREIALDWLDDRGVGPPTLVQPGSVACLPAQDALDEAGASILAALLRRAGIDASVAPGDLLISEKVAAAEAPGVRLAVVCGAGANVELHIRRMEKAIKRKRPAMPVVIAAWTGKDPGGVDPPAEVTVATVRAATLRQAITLVKSLIAVQPAPGGGDAAPP